MWAVERGDVPDAAHTPFGPAFSARLHLTRSSTSETVRPVGVVGRYVVEAPPVTAH